MSAATRQSRASWASTTSQLASTTKLSRRCVPLDDSGKIRRISDPRHQDRSMLHIQAFDNRAGGNVLYKALAHPLAAEAIGRLYARLERAGPVALYDPDGIAEALFALYPNAAPLAGLYVN